MPERERTPEQHERLFKASQSPKRRKMIQIIGNRGGDGISKDELREELKDFSDFDFKFNLEWLVREGFVVERDGRLYATEDGIDLMEAG